MMYSFKSSLSFIKFLFIFLILKNLLNNKIISSKFIIIVFSAIIFFVLIDSLLQIFTGYNILLLRSNYGQYSGIFADEYILGSYLSRSFFFLLIFFTMLKIKNKNLLIIILFIGILIKILFRVEDVS